MNGLSFTTSNLVADLLPAQHYSHLQQYFGTFGIELDGGVDEDEALQSSSLLNRPPLAVCLACGAYINSLVDVTSHPGKWICSICSHANGGRDFSNRKVAETKIGFDDDSDVFELNHPDYTCIEREPVFQRTIGNEKDSAKVLLVAIDLCYLKADISAVSHLLALLQDHCERIAALVPAGEDGVLSVVQVMVVLFDESLFRVVRLGGVRSLSEPWPLIADIVPLNQLGHRHHWTHLLRRGHHTLSLTGFLECFDVVKRGLEGLVTNLSHSPVPAPASALASQSPSLTHFYSFIQSLQVIYASIVEFKAVLFTSRSLALFPSNNSNTLSEKPNNHPTNTPIRPPCTLPDSEYLGRCFADRIYCSVDYFFFGNGVIVAHELLPFLAMTHGKLVLSEDVKEEHVTLNLYHSLSSLILSSDHSNNYNNNNSKRFFLRKKIEIRCNDNIALLRSFNSNNHNNNNNKSARRLLSLQHLKDMLVAGRRKRKEFAEVDELLSSHNNSDSKESANLTIKRFPHYGSVSLTGSASLSSELLPFDPFSLLLSQPGITEEELEEREIMAQFIDMHHLQRSYEDYLAYLHDEKMRHNRDIYRIPLTTFYNKINERCLEQADHFLDLSPHNHSNNNRDSNSNSDGSLSFLFNILDQSILFEEKQEEENVRDHRRQTSPSSSTSNNSYWTKLSQLLLTTPPQKTTSNINNNTEISEKAERNKKDSMGEVSKVHYNDNGNDNNKLSRSDSDYDSDHRGVVQITVKCLYILPKSRERVKETRVITLNIPITSSSNNKSKENQKEKGKDKDIIDWKLWTSLQLKSLVQHHHDSLQQLLFSSSSSYSSHSIDEQGNDAIKQQREAMIAILDESAQMLSKHWIYTGVVDRRDCCDFIRSLFLLREGPLLDGPSANREQASILRHHYLTGDTPTIIAPRVFLDTAYLPTSIAVEKPLPSSPTAVIEVVASSLMLFPATIALIDFGDSLVLRRNLSPSSFPPHPNFFNESAFKRLYSKAIEIAKSRQPNPRITVIAQCNTPQDRLVFARLSPSHMQLTNSAEPLTKATISKAILEEFRLNEGSLKIDFNQFEAIVRVFDLEDFHAMLASCPYTEQSYFTQYISLNASKLLYPPENSRTSINTANIVLPTKQPPPPPIISNTDLADV